MHTEFTPVARKLLLSILILGGMLIISSSLGLGFGSTGSMLGSLGEVFFRPQEADQVAAAIIKEIRLPRVVLAAAVGGTLALGGLVFQALLRNPLAEPYILGISGGSAVGAILGMFAGLAAFPGVSMSAFAGSMFTLGLVLILAGGRSPLRRDSLILGGVMMNAFFGAMIMFLISLSQDAQMRSILFWLMGDLSMISPQQLPVLLMVLPGMAVILVLARPMNLLLMGRDTAASMGVNVRLVTLALLVFTSLMVSVAVSQSGLIGFVGLAVPHIFRLILGPDHRLLIPACLLGGASYLILCDLLARTLPPEGEMPVGVVTALIGAPLFIYLLWRSRR